MYNNIANEAIEWKEAQNGEYKSSTIPDEEVLASSVKRQIHERLILKLAIGDHSRGAHICLLGILRRHEFLAKRRMQIRRALQRLEQDTIVQMISRFFVQPYLFSSSSIC